MDWKKTTIIIVITVLVLAAGIFSMYKYYYMKMDHMRTFSIQELENYVDMSEYGKKEQKKINAILEESEEQIMASNKQYEINQI